MVPYGLMFGLILFRQVPSSSDFAQHGFSVTWQGSSGGLCLSYVEERARGDEDDDEDLPAFACTVQCTALSELACDLHYLSSFPASRMMLRGGIRASTCNFFARLL